MAGLLASDVHLLKGVLDPKITDAAHVYTWACLSIVSQASGLWLVYTITLASTLSPRLIVHTESATSMVIQQRCMNGALLQLKKQVLCIRCLSSVQGHAACQHTLTAMELAEACGSDIMTHEYRQLGIWCQIHFHKGIERLSIWAYKGIRHSKNRCGWSWYMTNAE